MHIFIREASMPLGGVSVMFDQLCALQQSPSTKRGASLLGLKISRRRPWPGLHHSGTGASLAPNQVGSLLDIFPSGANSAARAGSGNAMTWRTGG